MLRMEHNDWTVKNKPYDLRLRLFEFACLICRLAQFLRTGAQSALHFVRRS